ncbi:MAG: hypothetical protein AUI16_29760 [Alphaproteobacteria bacterium 13_2_20CM_2_64_7]|jgi:hypothetical protein|nr:MAG: hypothetical protein AUI16_29760 [Alphaproteobacteria bacterium 13_2_20CM_2_64_7]
MTSGYHDMSKHLDRAAVIAAAMLQILDTAPRHGLRQAVEQYLHDELADLERQIAADRSGPDA